MIIKGETFSLDFLKSSVILFLVQRVVTYHKSVTANLGEA